MCFLCFGLRETVLAEFTSTKGAGDTALQRHLQLGQRGPRARLHGASQSGLSSALTAARRNPVVIFKTFRLCRSSLALTWGADAGPNSTPGVGGSCSCDSELIPPEGSVPGLCRASSASPLGRRTCSSHGNAHGPREWSGVTPRPRTAPHTARGLCPLRMRSHLVALCSVTFYELVSEYLSGNAIAEETPGRSVRRDRVPGTGERPRLQTAPVGNGFYPWRLCGEPTCFCSIDHENWGPECPLHCFLKISSLYQNTARLLGRKPEERCILRTMQRLIMSSWDDFA